MYKEKLDSLYAKLDEVTNMEFYELAMLSMEEMCELIQALNKFSRYKEYSYFKNIKEEIADVLICMKRLLRYFDIENSEIEEIIIKKIERQIKRGTK